MENNYLKFDFYKYNLETIKNIIKKFKKEDCKILYVSTYQLNHTRTETNLELLDMAAVKYKTIRTGNSKIKYLKALYFVFKEKKKYDLIFIAFRGHELLPFIKLITKKPIIFDAFVSIYDTMCFDRAIFKPNSLFGKFFKMCDILVCKFSDVVLVDTKAHQKYFMEEFNVSNVEYLYIGCNRSIFKELKCKNTSDQYQVLWYGSANPTQGVDVILKAAKLLEDENIYFTLIGPVKKKYAEIIDEINPLNVEYINYVAYNCLPEIINKSDLCLGGHFSNKNKASRVIPCKTYQSLACNVSTVVADNIANRELFLEKDLVHFVKPGDPTNLASKILELSKNET